MARSFTVLCAGLLLAGLTACGPVGGPAATSVAKIPSSAPLDTGLTSTSAPGTSVGVVCPTGVPLEARTYAVPPKLSEIPVPLTIMMTDGWQGCGLAYKELGEPAGLLMIGFWQVQNVYRNPCHWRGGLFEPPVGPTVDDLVEALCAQELTVATEPVDASIDGFDGRYVRFEVPVDVGLRGCSSDTVEEFRFWDGPEDSVWWLGAVDAPGLIGEVWALDIEGTRVVVQAASFADAPDSRRDEIHQIVGSIDFQP